MLKICGPLAAHQTTTYYQKEYSQGDYYIGSEEQPIAGIWLGKGAAFLETVWKFQVRPVFTR
jgi:hypothetical protein